MAALVRVSLSPEPVSLDKAAKRLAEATNGAGAGSLVVFMGFVKGLVDGRRVGFLEYEAVEDLALQKLREIADWAAGIEGVYAVEIVHRVGRLRPGEPTIYIFVVAEPRQLAFRLASEILDRVKKEVPVYKLEGREDGEYWILGDHTRIPRGSQA
jgi:molybdopterin synthase catalytic subunit